MLAKNFGSIIIVFSALYKPYWKLVGFVSNSGVFKGVEFE